MPSNVTMIAPSSSCLAQLQSKCYMGHVHFSALACATIGDVDLSSHMCRCNGSIHGLHEDVLKFAAAMRQSLSQLGTVFGSHSHLRTGYHRLGMCEGVPLVSIVHETTVSELLAM